MLHVCVYRHVFKLNRMIYVSLYYISRSCHLELVSQTASIGIAERGHYLSRPAFKGARALYRLSVSVYRNAALAITKWRRQHLSHSEEKESPRLYTRIARAAHAKVVSCDTPGQDEPHHYRQKREAVSGFFVVCVCITVHILCGAWFSTVLLAYIPCLRNGVCFFFFFLFFLPF